MIETAQEQVMLRPAGYAALIERYGLEVAIPDLVAGNIIPYPHRVQVATR